MARAARKIHGLAERLIGSQEQGRLGSHPVRTLTGIPPSGFLEVPIEKLKANPHQPRKYFDQAALEELTDSIREKGLLQAVTVYKDPNGDGFILIAGERRLRAARAAGLTTIPAIVRPGEDADELAIVENVQRDDLNAMDLAESLRELKERKSYTDEMLAKVIGKSRTTVTELLTLTTLPKDLKTELSAGRQLPKTVIFQALRDGGPENLRELLDGGDTITRAQLRAKKKARTGGRPKNFSHVYAPPAGTFRVTVSFSKSKVDLDEVKGALKEALRELRG